MRRLSKVGWALGSLFGAVVLLIVAPAAAQEVSGPSTTEGMPGDTIHFEGNLIGCYGGPGSETSYFGFPDRVVLYWNPIAMTDEELEAFNGEITSTRTLPPGMQELASLTFNESNHGWTLDATVPGGEVGQHAMVLGFEPQCQWKVLNGDGTVTEDKRPDYRAMSYCVLDTDGECQHTAAALASVNEGESKGFDPADYAFAGAGLAFTVVGGAVVRSKGGRTQRTHVAPDPCHAPRQRLAQAAVSAHVLQDALQDLRGMREALEAAYEDKRETSYNSLLVDVASFAGGLWAGPLASVAPALVADVAFTGLVANIAKSIGTSMAKDFVNYLNTEAVADPAGWVTKIPAGEAKKELLKRFRDHLVTRKMQQYLNEGGYGKKLLTADGHTMRDVLGTGETDYGGVRKIVADNYQTVFDVFSKINSLDSLRSGALAAIDDLAHKREALLHVGSHINNAEGRLNDALSELDIARHAFNLCAHANPGAA